MEADGHSTDLPLFNIPSRDRELPLSHLLQNGVNGLEELPWESSSSPPFKPDFGHWNKNHRPADETTMNVLLQIKCDGWSRFELAPGFQVIISTKLPRDSRTNVQPRRGQLKIMAPSQPKRT